MNPSGRGRRVRPTVTDDAAAGSSDSPRPGQCSPTELTARERELLAVTLAVLQEVGYDRMSVDEVAARARASKSTVYRRWPSKADLVVAAFSEGVRQVAVPPDTGSLRGDLLALAHMIAEHARLHSSTITGTLPEVRRNPALSAVVQHEFVHQRRALIHQVLGQAVARGEIEPAAVNDEIWDVLPNYLIFRTLIPGREITEHTITSVVDDLLLPSLTRLS